MHRQAPLKRSLMKRGRIRIGAAALRRRRNGGPRAVGRRAVSDAEWGAIRERVFARSGNRCEVGCPRRATDPHHVVPRSLGGSDDECNIIALCRSHHRQVDAPYRTGRLVIWGQPGAWQWQIVTAANKWAARGLA